MKVFKRIEGIWVEVDYSPKRMNSRGTWYDIPKTVKPKRKVKNKWQNSGESQD